MKKRRLGFVLLLALLLLAVAVVLGYAFGFFDGGAVVETQAPTGEQISGSTSQASTRIPGNVTGTETEAPPATATATSPDLQTTAQATTSPGTWAEVPLFEM